MCSRMLSFLIEVSRGRAQSRTVHTCTTCTAYHHRELNTLLDILLLADLGL